MNVLGYRPATIERRAWREPGERSTRSLTKRSRSHRNTKSSPATTPGGRVCLQVRQRKSHVHKLARLDLPTVATCARQEPQAASMRLMCDGRIRRRAQAPSTGAADAVPHGSRPAPGRSIYQQDPPRMLPSGREAFGGKMRRRAAVDARRQRTGRLGHGDGHLGGVADGDGGPHRADCERTRRGRLCDRRHRHRHLHHLWRR